MSRNTIGFIVVAAAIALLGVYIARNSYWTTETISTPAKGEAVRNPFYAAQKYAEALGTTTEWRREFGGLPSPDSVIVLSAWRWDLIEGRTRAMKRWVESGGRLVADRSIMGADQDLKKWSGISRDYSTPAKQDSSHDDAEEKEEETTEAPATRPFGQPPARCRVLDTFVQDNTIETGRKLFEACNFDFEGRLLSSREPNWSLITRNGAQVVRVPIGTGSITLLNGTPFRNKGLFDGDHAQLFVAATQLRRGDHIYFLSDDESEALLTLMWRYGAPVIVLAFLLVAIGLWRGSARFGPLTATPDSARRSLGEQIRGTGWFTVRHGGGKALREAAVRALFETGRRRIVNFNGLSAEERIKALAKHAGLAPDALATAINFAGPRRPGELRETLLLLETARRTILTQTDR